MEEQRAVLERSLRVSLRKTLSAYGKKSNDVQARQACRQGCRQGSRVRCRVRM